MNELWNIERIAMDRGLEADRAADLERRRRSSKPCRPRLVARIAGALRGAADRLDTLPAGHPPPPESLYRLSR
ncbi:MAG: hypothetical protein NVS9B1_23970 [Candidatus Dormibacteraceae bacterium]